MNQKLMITLSAICVLCLGLAYILMPAPKKPPPPPPPPTFKELAIQNPRLQDAYDQCSVIFFEKEFPSDQQEKVCQCAARSFGRQMKVPEWTIFQMKVEGQRRKDQNFFVRQLDLAASRDTELAAIRKNVDTVFANAIKELTAKIEQCRVQP